MAVSSTTSLSLPSFQAPLSFHNTILLTDASLFLPARRIKSFVEQSFVTRAFAVKTFSGHSLTIEDQPLKALQTLLRVSAVSTLIFFSLDVRVGLASPYRNRPVLTAGEHTLQEDLGIEENDGEGKSNNAETLNDEDTKAAFETWKSKTFALSVPLRIVALNGSIPPSWLKDFMQSQGKRSKFHSKYAASLKSIFLDLSTSFSKSNIGPTSTVAADIVSMGDSWLSFAIKRAIVEPIKGVEEEDWFKGLGDKWKAYLRRNSNGEVDPEGEIWAAPYRWGTMVIAYKKSKFEKHKMAPIEDWADLWRPELAGKISMVDCPREVVGAVLKYMGASYNEGNIDLQVTGGKSAVLQNLTVLGKQVRLFDNKHYIKAFGLGDVWVAVGWSSDILPAAKRLSNVAVVVPKSGASIWADLWAVPGASRLRTSNIGGRIRGPSPLIHQWIEFCLQSSRALPFKQEVIPGSAPSDLENDPFELPEELMKGKPKLDTNLIGGVPPREILARCEFLEPLTDDALSDYKWLIASIHKAAPASTNRVRQYVTSLIQTFCSKIKGI